MEAEQPQSFITPLPTPSLQQHTTQHALNTHCPLTATEPPSPSGWRSHLQPHPAHSAHHCIPQCHIPAAQLVTPLLPRQLALMSDRSLEQELLLSPNLAVFPRGCKSSSQSKPSVQLNPSKDSKTTPCSHASIFY